MQTIHYSGRNGSTDWCHAVIADKKYPDEITIQAKLKVNKWETGAYARTGVGVRVDSKTGEGYVFLFSDHRAAKPFTVVSFLNDHVAWGPAESYEWEMDNWLQSMRKKLRRIFHSIFFQFFLVVAVLWAYHCICPHWEKWGNPKISPFFGGPSMDFNTWIILPLIAFGVYLFIFRTILKARHPIPLPILLVLTMALKVAIDISVALINGGLPALAPDILQYYADVPHFESVGDIFRNYVQKAQILTVHSGTHPPGGTLFMWLVAHLFVYDKLTTSFAIILFAPLALIPMYLLSEQFYSRRVGLYTLALYLVIPNLVMFTATSMDAVFTVFLIWSVYLFYYSLKKKSIILAILTGISLGVSMFFNFTTTFLGVFFIAVVILTYFNNRQEFRNYLTVLLISGGVFCVFYLLLYLLTGYNFLACLRGAILIDEKGSLHHSGCGTGYETVSRYFFLSVTNLFAFFSCIGVPIATLWFRKVGNTVRNAFLRRADTEGCPYDNYLLAYVIVLIGIAFATLYTLETERIWIFMAPFLLIPAAKNLLLYVEEKKNQRMFYIVTIMLCIQTLAFEILIDTRW